MRMASSEKSACGHVSAFTALLTALLLWPALTSQASTSDRPIPPLDASVKIVTTNTGRLAAVATVVLPHPGYGADWGDLTREENHFAAEVTILPPDDGIYPQVLTPVSHTCELPDLTPGDYRFSLYSGGQRIATVLFTVPLPKPPFPKNASIIVRPGNFAWLAAVKVEPPAGAFVSDWSELRRNGNTFEVSVALNWFPAIPEAPLPNERMYHLGPLDPGEYRIRLLSRDQVVTVHEFSVPPRDIPARASIAIRRDGPAIFADVRVAFTGYPYYMIDDWGEAKQNGGRFLIDATAARVEYVQPPDLPVIQEHSYQLFPRLTDDSTDASRKHFFTVVFRMNGIVFATTGFSIPPSPDIPPGAVSLNARTADDGVTIITVTLDLSQSDAAVAPVWEKPVREGRRIVANAALSPVPEAETDRPRVFTHEYRLEDLDSRARTYLFVMKVNGHPKARLFFVPAGHIAYNDWLARIASEENESSEFADPVGPEDLDDFNGNGLSNFYEYALGLDPLDPGSRNAVEASLDESGGVKHFHLAYKERTTGGLNYRVEFSDDLKNWKPADGLCETLSRASEADDAGLESVTLCFSDAFLAGGPRFVRIVAEPE